jgi:hypothetical protein
MGTNLKVIPGRWVSWGLQTVHMFLGIKYKQARCVRGELRWPRGHVSVPVSIQPSLHSSIQVVSGHFYLQAMQAARAGRVVWIIQTSGWFDKLTHLPLDWGIIYEPTHTAPSLWVAQPSIKMHCWALLLSGRSQPETQAQLRTDPNGDKAAAISVLGWTEQELSGLPLLWIRT